MSKLGKTFVRALMTLLLAGAGTFGLASGASAHTRPAATLVPFAPGEFHEIRNIGHLTPMCVQPQSAAFGARIIQRPCDGSSIQGWAALDMKNNHYRFLNSVAGLCLFASDTAANGQPIFLDECAVAGGTTVSNAEWNTGMTLPSGDVHLRTRVHFRDNNFCLDEPGNSGADNLALQIFACNNTTAQRWSVGLN